MDDICFSHDSPLCISNYIYNLPKYKLLLFVKACITYEFQNQHCKTNYSTISSDRQNMLIKIVEKQNIIKLYKTMKRVAINSKHIHIK